MSDTTIYTIAKELNMTPSMVSRAFNPNGKISQDKRMLVLETAKKYNFSPNKFASRLSMKTVRIGILINSRFSINTDRMIEGIENAYAKLKDYKIKYDITVMNPAENGTEDYIRVLQGYKGFDGVILTGMSSSKYTDAINMLFEYNPNIVQVQAINKNAHFLFESKHNEEVASEIAAEFLFNCLKNSAGKNILLFTGDKDSTLHSAAEGTFKKACKKFGLNISECIDMKDNEDYFTKILPEVFENLETTPDGIYITSGFSAPLCKYLEEKEIDVPFVAFDVYEDIKAYMEKGIISAAIYQNVFNQMGVAFETLVKHLITGEDFPKTVYVDVHLALKSNIHQYI